MVWCSDRRSVNDRSRCNNVYARKREVVGLQSSPVRQRLNQRRGAEMEKRVAGGEQGTVRYGREARYL